jgi:hypothetical protein
MDRKPLATSNSKHRSTALDEDVKSRMQFTKCNTDQPARNAGLHNDVRGCCEALCGFDWVIQKQNSVAREHLDA